MTTTLALLPLLLVNASQPEVVDRVAAVLNGDVIMLSDLTEATGGEWARVQAMPDGADKDRVRGELLRAAFEQVLASRLLSQAAAREGLEITEPQLDAQLEEIRSRNDMDQERFEKEVAAQFGDFAAYRAMVKRDLEAMLVLETRVRSRVKLGEQDLKNYYQTHAQEYGGEPEVHLRHIFLPLPEDAPPDVQKKVRAEADRVRARLLAGADFAEEAKRVSKGPSAPEGGELGWIRHGSIDPAVEAAAFALEPGKISDWVRAGPGIHVFKVEERRLGGAKTFEEAKEEIRGRLYQQQVEGFRAEIIAELKKEAVIEPKLPELEGLVAQVKAGPKKK